MAAPLLLRSGLAIPADELEVRTARSSGPGGQNVNKVESKVELRFALGRTRVLRGDVIGRLRALAGHRCTLDGWLVVVCQETRDQGQNLGRAREKLAELIERALIPPKPRRPTKPTKGSVRRRLEGKKHAAAKKKGRGGGGGGQNDW